MLYVFIDDSGTAPSQRIAIACALIIPASRISSFDLNWREFDRNYKFNGDFHSAICAARNKDSVFADWNDRRVRNAFRRLRRIMKSHASCAFSFGIHKDQFRSIAPASWLEIGGKESFTWSLRTLLNTLRTWNHNQPNPMSFEYVLDWMEPHDQHEVNMLMAQFESAYPGEYEGHFSFRKRRAVPALQACDHVAWSAFAASRLLYEKTPLSYLVQEALADMQAQNQGNWLNMLIFDEESLKDTVELDSQDVEGETARRRWYEEYIAKNKPPKRSKKSSARYNSRH